MLELSKALSFFASIVALWSAAIYAFFDPAARWEERLWVVVSKLAIAACICFCSGLLFRWPSRTNPDAGQSLTSTLPVKMFLWAGSGIAVAFVAFWYLVTAAPCIATVSRSCGLR